MGSIEDIQKSPYRCKRQHYGEVCGKPLYYDLTTVQMVDGKVLFDLFCMECYHGQR